MRMLYIGHKLKLNEGIKGAGYAEILEIYDTSIYMNLYYKDGSVIESLSGPYLESDLNFSIIVDFPWDESEDKRKFCNCPLATIMSVGCKCGGK